MEGLDAKERKRVEYFSRQILDMFSPTNFLGTNPEALERAVATEGQSLVDGLENLVRDIEANEGELLVSLADKNAFKVGENLATTEGSVVFRNRMFELIQYAPKTETVHKTPLIIFPPWINKFYIMDLKPQNSLISWIVEQGYTLFVVSWVNPDASYADVGMDTYVEEGYLTAIKEVKAITDVPKVNVVGYCIAGTTLALTLALMKKRKDTSINSATFFTALTDFEDQGEVGVFLNDDFVDGIEQEVSGKGHPAHVLHGAHLQFPAFERSDLRPRDQKLHDGPDAARFRPAVLERRRHQPSGADVDRVPARACVRTTSSPRAKSNCWVRSCRSGMCRCRSARLPAKPIISRHGNPATMASARWDRRTRPLSCRSRAISPGSSIRLRKRSTATITNPDMGLSHEDWKDTADFNEGSWWPTWEKWLAKRSGAMVEARKPGDSKHPILAPAPGTYVVADPNT